MAFFKNTSWQAVVSPKRWPSHLKVLLVTSPLFGLGLVGCVASVNQVNPVQEPVQPQPTVAAPAPAATPAHMGRQTIQTQYGQMIVGQVVQLDGQLFYVNSNGLLPVTETEFAMSEALVEDDSIVAVKTPSGISITPGVKPNQPRVKKARKTPEAPLAPTPKVTAVDPKGKQPQFVMLAFDGSKSLDMWQKTRSFARANNIKFTYFISGVYFLSPKTKHKYKSPRSNKTTSLIGWGDSAADVQARLAQLNAAFNEGHEIASHANGHFDGSGWTQAHWDKEFKQFHSIMANAYVNHGLPEPAGWRNKVKNRMFKGFRAPLLGHSSGMWPTLRKYGYRYDTSLTSGQTYQPKIRNGVWNFPLASVKLAHTRRNALSMDYNFYVAQSGAKPDSKNGAKYEEEMVATYLKYFNRNYKGNRAPVHIGHHFSRWNGGAYWRAMKRFAKAVCKKPGVRCTTYQNLANYLRSRNGGGRVAQR